MGRMSFNATVATLALSLVAPLVASFAGATDGESIPVVQPNDASASSPGATPVATTPAASAPVAASPTAAPPKAATPVASTPATSPAWGPLQVVVYKAARRLALYRHGAFEREFPVVLGLHPEGRKRHAHDARTPEGLYRVAGKARHPRWQHFLAIDYPNVRDKAAYAAEVHAGRVPLEDDAPFGIGSEVGIHGNDRPAEQEKGVDWTKGCVAMRESDIAVLAAAVPVGTPVWIVP